MSVYRVTEVIGVSDESWEAAARSAVETAAGTVRVLRVAEVVRQDVTIENAAGSPPIESGWPSRLSTTRAAERAAGPDRRRRRGGRWRRIRPETTQRPTTGEQR